MRLPPPLAPIAVVLALTQTACSGALADGDGRAFGDDLGTFHVSAQLESSSCGPGALDSPESWDFDVTLSKKDPVLYWNTGAAAEKGDLDNDGVHFVVASELAVTLRDPKEDGLGCVVTRRDTVDATLDDAENIRAFSGTFEFRFIQQGDGDCTVPLIEENIEELPCRMSYAMTGTRGPT